MQYSYPPTPPYFFIHRQPLSLRCLIDNLSEAKTKAMKSVMSAFYARYTNLEKAFEAMDVDKTGYITLLQVV